MTKAKISEYDAVASNNTDVNGVNIAEGCPPSGMNNMGREIMAALKRFQVGSDGDGVTVGGNLVVSGSSTLSTTSISSADINAGTIDGTAIGGSSAAAGSFTTLNTSGAVVFNDAGADVDFRVEGDTDANLLFVDASTDRVGVGTNAPSCKLDIIESSVGSSGATSNGIRVITTGTSNGLSVGQSNVARNINIGSYYISGTGEDFQIGSSSAHQLVFTTNATERARITSGGFFKASNTGTYVNATSSPHEIISNVGGANVLNIVNSSANPYGPVINLSGASPDNNSNYFLACADSTSVRMYIYSDGDVWTADAGILSSDQKLKNTITDASPKLDDVMKLRVRNFYWNEDYHPEKTDKKLIGFIAQEFEEVFPGLVTEGVIRGGNPIYEDQAVVDEEGNPVLDEEGNAKTEQVKVGETEKEYAKGIKEGKLIPILVKALQEAVERIETLEAKVAALENA